MRTAPFFVWADKRRVPHYTSSSLIGRVLEFGTLHQREKRYDL